jgi:hypothetical protein
MVRALTGRRIRRIRKTPGDYYVTFVNPNESYYTGFSPQDQGANDTLDSDANTTGYTTVTTLEAYETDLSWDAVYRRFLSFLRSACSLSVCLHSWVTWRTTEERKTDN